MSRIAICMASGCEEIEGLTVVDVVRRAGMDIDMIAVSDEPLVTGSHGISFVTDKMIAEVNWADYDGIVLPGGIPGTPNLSASSEVTDALRLFAQEGKLSKTTFENYKKQVKAKINNNKQKIEKKKSDMSEKAKQAASLHPDLVKIFSGIPLFAGAVAGNVVGKVISEIKISSL